MKVVLIEAFYLILSIYSRKDFGIGQFSKKIQKQISFTVSLEILQFRIYSKFTDLEYTIT